MEKTRKRKRKEKEMIDEYIANHYTMVKKPNSVILAIIEWGKRKGMWLLWTDPLKNRYEEIDWLRVKRELESVKSPEEMKKVVMPYTDWVDWKETEDAEEEQNGNGIEEDSTLRTIKKRRMV